MPKIPFDISEIRVTKSTMGDFGLDIFLESGTQLKGKFKDHSMYFAAEKVNGNLPKLKYIFREIIENILKENPQYFNQYSLCKDFYKCMSHIVDDLTDDKSDTYKDSMELIRSCAVEKNIEFDGYFLQRWSDSADTIINFDEEYFEDPDRRDLYVFLSAMVDDEIFEFLRIAFQLFESEPLTKDFVHTKIDYLTKEKGVSF